MLRRNLTTLSWIMLGIAVLLWCVAGFFVSHIDGAESSYLADVQQSQASAGQTQSAAIAHLSVQRSGAQSAQLSTALAVDPVAFASLLQSVAGASGASVQISSAVPESIPNASSGGPQVYAFGFSVQVSGTFNADMRALQLLQTLPAPSSIQEVDLASVAASGKQPASWDMTVQVRLVTTDNISS